MQEDKRRSYRYPVVAAAEMTTTDEEGFKVVTGTVHNIGRHGMRVSSVNPVPTGNPISIQLIEIMDVEFRDTIKGSVAWISDLGIVHNMGIRFDEEVSPEHQPHLYEKFFQYLDEEK